MLGVFGVGRAKANITLVSRDAYKAVERPDKHACIEALVFKKIMTLIMTLTPKP